jgi:hypothetical protein
MPTVDATPVPTADATPVPARVRSRSDLYEATRRFRIDQLVYVIWRKKIINHKTQLETRLMVPCIWHISSFLRSVMAPPIAISSTRVPALDGSHGN